MSEMEESVTLNSGSDASLVTTVTISAPSAPVSAVSVPAVLPPAPLSSAPSSSLSGDMPNVQGGRPIPPGSERFGFDKEELERSKCLFVGNLPKDIARDDPELQRMLEEFGPHTVTKCGNAKGVPNSAYSGFLFVEYTDKAMALNAHNKLSNKVFKGANLRVDWDVGADKKKRGRGRGGRGGRREGRRDDYYSSSSRRDYPSRRGEEGYGRRYDERREDDRYDDRRREDYSSSSSSSRRYEDDYSSSSRRDPSPHRDSPSYGRGYSPRGSSSSFKRRREGYDDSSRRSPSPDDYKRSRL